MSPSLAFEKIRTAFVRMDAFYGRTVFDEWAVLAADGPKFTVLSYEGPRADTFESQVRADLRQLQFASEGDRREPGAFGFARDAQRSAIDAYIILGPSLFLLCNNTTEAIAELAADPLWRKAQVPFAELAEVFRHHPVSLTAVA